VNFPIGPLELGDRNGYNTFLLVLEPTAGGTQRLPRIIGYARAFELIRSGCRLTGTEAVAWGLASRAVPRPDVLDTACRLARSFAVHPETALRQAKSLQRRSQVVPVEMGREAELDAMLTLLDRADLST
jgi:enoyl-CoA hydratase/carnithine racemase